MSNVRALKPKPSGTEYHGNAFHFVHNDNGTGRVTSKASGVSVFSSNGDLLHSIVAAIKDPNDPASVDHAVRLHKPDLDAEHQTAKLTKLREGKQTMARKRTVVENNNDDNEILDETAASDTLQMHPSAASKAGMMASVMNSMSSMSNDECCKWFEQMMATMNSQNLASQVPGDAAAKNAASIQMKGKPVSESIKEDIAELFGDENLAEEFKDKASTLFEAAVNSRVTLIEAQLLEETEQILEEQVEQLTEEMIDHIDRYVSYVASEWLKENEVAIERALEVELAESFMGEIKQVIARHNFSFPEKIDIVETLQTEIDQLTTALDQQMEQNIALTESIEQFNRQEIIDELAEGLTMTQADRFEQLAEGIAFNGDYDQYRHKLEIIKQHNFKPKSIRHSTLNEEVDVDEPAKPVYADPGIERYVKSISRLTSK